jgi:hypothetical protein
VLPLFLKESLNWDKSSGLVVQELGFSCRVVRLETNYEGKQKELKAVLL